MRLFIYICFLLLVSCQNKGVDKSNLQDGDIIFQTSTSQQSKAIQLATKSEYSHCGIIYKEKDKYFVFEAVQPVKLTPLDEWIPRGRNSHFVIKRLKNAEKVLTPKILDEMKKTGNSFKGKDYDLYFEWDNDRIYCSELIWKIYKEGAGIEIGNLQKLEDFDLSHPVVRQKLEERYGNNIPKKEKVISPVAIFNSDLLYTVEDN